MLESDYETTIHQRTYARWDYDKGRRETWEETVARYCEFMQGHLSDRFNFEDKDLFEDIFDSITSLKVMPSMRALMTAGPALERDNIAGFNCSFVNMDNQRAFDEIVYILMCGTGVGFSVERQHINQLPEIPSRLYTTDTVIQVRDSKLVWAKAYKELITLLYAGHIPKWDISLLRPAGAPLKTFGGRASGPKPLVDLFNFTIRKFKGATGRKLESIEVHDIVCKIGDVVVSGGVRRSALISLSNLSDQRMRDAKSGQWWETDPHRRLANNSAAYTERPEVGHFMQEWLALYQSKSGERGIFNRMATLEKCKSIDRDIIDNDGNIIQFGTNPCAEIILRSMEFCNLTEVVARSNDTEEDLEYKTRMASILGTFQSTLTNYRYIRSEWTQNSREERLLGVSITGIMDCPLLNKVSATTENLLIKLRSIARLTNYNLATKLGIEASAAITCVKPSGTVSQLVNSSSGIHPRYSDHYIRRIRVDIKDPLCKFLQDSGIPNEEDIMNPTQQVFEYPIAAPKDAITEEHVSALSMLGMWKMYRDNWCDHNPSVTISVKEWEWPQVGAWVWEHFDEVGGLSFLPSSDHIYQQAVYEPISEEDFKQLNFEMPETVDWDKFSGYEESDFTTGSQELACIGGNCEV